MRDVTQCCSSKLISNCADGTSLTDPIEYLPSEDGRVGRIAVILEVQFVPPNVEGGAVAGPAAEVALHMAVRGTVEQVSCDERIRVDDELVGGDPDATVQHLITGQLVRCLIRIDAPRDDVILGSSTIREDEQALH